MSLRRKMEKAAAGAVGLQRFKNMDVSMATDVMQSRIIHSLFSGMTRDLLLVKGGIGMRVLTGSQRDTTDIDLAAEPESNMSTIRSHMSAAINSALACGLIENAEVREQDTRNGGLNPKWHISGRLAGSQSKIHLKIEVSRRDLLPEEGISRFEYSPSSPSAVGRFTVRTYSPMAMAASKVAALLDRRRHKARDIYDLMILIETKVEPPVAMLAAMGEEKLQEMMESLFDKVFGMGYQSFEQDIAPYLPIEIAKRIDKESWEDMQLTVVDHVQDWLRRAKGIAGEPVPRSDLRNHFDEICARKMKP